MKFVIAHPDGGFIQGKYFGTTEDLQAARLFGSRSAASNCIGRQFRIWQRLQDQRYIDNPNNPARHPREAYEILPVELRIVE